MGHTESILCEIKLPVNDYSWPPLEGFVGCLVALSGLLQSVDVNFPILCRLREKFDISQRCAESKKLKTQSQ